MQLCEAAWLLLFLLFLADIKFRVKCIEVLRIQMFFYNIQSFAKPLKMHNLAFPQETDRVADVRVFDKAQDVVIGRACLLLCRHIFH